MTEDAVWVANVKRDGSHRYRWESKLSTQYYLYYYEKVGSCISGSSAYTLKVLNTLIPVCPSCLIFEETFSTNRERCWEFSWNWNPNPLKVLAWEAEEGTAKAINLIRWEAPRTAREKGENSPHPESEVSVNQSVSIQHICPPPPGPSQAVPAARWRRSGSLGFLKHLLVPLRMRSKSTLALLEIYFSTLTPATTAKFFAHLPHKLPPSGVRMGARWETNYM